MGMEHVSCRDVIYHLTKRMMTVNEVATNAPKHVFLFLSPQILLLLVLLILLQNSLWVNVQHGKHGENPET